MPTELKRKLSVHPLDVLAGTMVPQMQSYVTCVPAMDVDAPAFRAKLVALMRERFPRFCYRLLERWGSIAELRLADDLGAPVSVTTPGEMERISVREMEASLGERHWRLHVVPGPTISVLVLLFDHYLAHGMTGRRFLFKSAEALGAKADDLDSAQRSAFIAFQKSLTEKFHAQAPWASYHKLELDADHLRALSKALRLPFTEATTLWLARSLHDVAGRDRPMRILSFRMSPEAEREPVPDAAVGNKHLQMQLWEMHPSGDYAPVGPGQEAARRHLEQFVTFYRWFPCKPVLNWLIRLGFERTRAKENKLDLELLVINNMGSTDVPFFRTLFFNPAAAEEDRFGLVFVDGHLGRVSLQLCPPRRYLARFDFPAFERRLAENLEGMRTDPRIRAR